MLRVHLVRVLVVVLLVLVLKLGLPGALVRRLAHVLVWLGRLRPLLICACCLSWHVLLLGSLLLLHLGVLRCPHGYGSPAAGALDEGRRALPLHGLLLLLVVHLVLVGRRLVALGLLRARVVLLRLLLRRHGLLLAGRVHGRPVLRVLVRLHAHVLAGRLAGRHRHGLLLVRDHRGVRGAGVELRVELVVVGVAVCGCCCCRR